MRMSIRGRRRRLDEAKKARLCELIAQSDTIEQAAETQGVSLRTVQRERKFDEDFDHELRLALKMRVATEFEGNDELHVASHEAAIAGNVRRTA